jgi:peptide/nickel transport system substrate-binding protein
MLGQSAALAGGAILGGGLSLPGGARADETPCSGGHLRLGLAGGSTTDSLDPRTFYDSAPICIGYQIMNGLIEIDEQNEPQPELLESWEMRNGAAQWIFNVRKGVTFHNGRPLIADDVIYSMNLHRGKDSPSGIAAPMQVISDIRRVNDHQISVTLQQPDVDFLFLLGDFHLMVVPDGFTDWVHPIGTGAYKLESFQPGEHALATRHDGYWKPGRGLVDSVESSMISDGMTRLNALLSGQVDVINRVDKKLVPTLDSGGAVSTLRSEGGWHGYMAMMVDTPPFNDKDLRLALKYGIDRQQILKSIFNDYGHVGNDHPIPPSDKFFNTELEQRPYDPDKAAFHAKKAGLKDAVTLSASDAPFNGAVDMAILYQSALKRAGIDLKVKREATDGFWENVWLKAPFATSYWGGTPTASLILSMAYKSDAAWNDSHWKRPDFDKLLAQAKAELDEGKRKEYLWEMQRQLHEDGGAVIPIFSSWIDAHGAKVKGLNPHRWLDLGNLRVAEKAWLAS